MAAALRALLVSLAVWGVALAAVPAEWLGLGVSYSGGAWVFSGRGVSFAYVPGVGWAPPLPPDLPPPRDGDLALEVEVLRAAGVLPPGTRVARVRHARYPEKIRLVFDLEEGPPLAGLTRDRGPWLFELPFFADSPPDLPELTWRYREGKTLLAYRPQPGSLAFAHGFYLKDPPRYVLDLYSRPQPWVRELAPGVRLRMRYLWVPYPLKVYAVEADPGSFRLVPVGEPGVRARVGEMAPGALAALNGGYFDPGSGHPVGLWVVDGVALSYPYGRSALVWDGGRVDATIPLFKARVSFSGREYPVGLNLTPARFTAYTVPGLVGREGEEVLVVRDRRVVARREAPYQLAAGYWALAYPRGEDPFARIPIGTPMTLRVWLDPPVRYALEAGPLLVSRGRFAYHPERERFAKNAIQLTKVTYQAAVAWTREGELWLLVSEKTTPRVLARGLAGAGAWGAIRMDSGGSAQLWAKGELVYPKYPRKVVNGLALYPRLGQ